jgi:hypothetical protein
MNEYILVSRKNTKAIHLTNLPKGSQRAKELKFFVQTKYIEKFPKKGFSVVAFYFADFIFADGVLVKSRF